jgi:2-amino-4-hydroxy-6-hydroxymethyldihydropteridine diphosphokinase
MSLAERAFRWTGAPVEPYALVALGTNLSFQNLSGAALLKAALQEWALRDLKVIARSSFWLSPAWPDPSEPAYTNAVVLMSPKRLNPQGVMDRLLRCERAFGRVRGAVWAPRTLDLDLIDFDGLVLRARSEAGLSLPHPRCADRAFVLAPLAQVAPGWCHPVTGVSVQDLLARAKDRDLMQELPPETEERV